MLRDREATFEAALAKLRRDLIPNEDVTRPRAQIKRERS